MDFSVRPAGRDDIAGIDALLARAYPRLLKADYPASVLVTALPLISRAQPALVTSGTYYVAEDRAGRLLGGGGWTAAIPGRSGLVGPGRANVRHMVTDDRAVRRGIGSAVLGRALAEARAAGMAWMHCLSTRTAVPFYESMGFTALGTVTVPLAPGIDFPAVEMRRDL
ncbi:MAG: GNAT family N-acetyltransferase [Rhodobacteraceae bacterium]|jgi:GNAT superfamily N-acetyltransferase|uniref:GNAT family N-acetyltransferase n=1 Tax=Albidovulum sp. TaxID=1872424 RepID=UPI001E0F646C|nr:GNAT family N-acetyltransferase [uncultured Defluviimonas sp.]MCB2125049.1 GNAT family N-acetyltransferase [Paracoccaceae bacterium]MCC0068920.1 GNAT family N-acetyltransferase [Paracoccaceae bacterium]